VSEDPEKVHDYIRVTDSSLVPQVATSKILIGTPLLLFCDIIQKEMGLADGRVWLWDQKIFQPTDSGLYIAISVLTCKPFGNVNYNNLGGNQNAYVAMQATLDVDIISRGPAARDRKEEIVIALQSQYAQQQQEKNSFYIGRIPTAFKNLSNVDGAAIPYRFNISVAIQYAYLKVSPSQYFTTLLGPDVYTNP